MLAQINNSQTKTDLFQQLSSTNAENKATSSSSKLLSGVKGPQEGSFKQKMKEQDERFSSENTDASAKTTEERQASVKSREPTKETKSEVAPDKPPEEATGKARGSPVAKRQKVFQEFMDSIESELGIDPARFAEAMAKVGAQTEQSKPEEVADLVIANLDLQAEDKDQAKQMYLGFLAALSQAEKPPEIKNLVVADAMTSQPQEILKRFNSAQTQKQVLNSSVEQMNRKFWMKETPVTSAAVAVPPAMMGQSDLTQALEGMAQPLASEVSVPVAATAVQIPQGFEEQQKLLNEVASRQRLAEWTAQANQTGPNSMMLPMQANAQAKPAAASLSLEQQVAILAAQQNASAQPSQSETVKSPKVLLNEETYSAAAKVPGGGLGLLNVAGAVAGNASASELADQSFSDKEFGDSLGEQHQQADMTVPEGQIKGDLGLVQNRPGNFFPPTAVLAGAQPTATQPGDVNESIQHVLNQAKFLAQKGGGEMNVQMTPEGLGKVHLKVLMNDGKLQVQMAADTKEAKSLLESNLTDLKHHLQSQKLSVENVKVDFVQGTNTDNNSQQTQTNLNNFQQREGTKQFWNQFQESFGNRSQREGFFELPNSKKYATQDKDPLAPIVSNQTRRIEGKGRGLNLVA